MYERGPDEAELKAFGLTAEDFEVDPIEIWPENEQAFSLFCSLGTQWRSNMNGPTGLDYGALPDVMRMMAIPRKEWPELFESIRVMESAALSEINKK